MILNFFITGKWEILFIVSKCADNQG